jgi:glycosyltransferase involved in cell wall biosynthesis
MNPTISIICPVRNMAGRLQNLETWVRECNSTFQILLVCDSSTDKTYVELQDIKSAYPAINIEILKGEFGSPGNARNAGLEQANGIWVTFWDSDDVGNPQLIFEEMRKYDPELFDAIVFGFDIYSGSHKLKPWTLWPNGIKNSINRTSLNPGIWRFCFKRSSILDFKFSHLRMAEDQLFINEFMRKSPQLSFNNSITYSYFVDVENQLTSNELDLGDLREVVEVLSSQIRREKDVEVFTIRIFGRILITQIKKSKIPLKFNAAFKLANLAGRYPIEVTNLIFDTLLEKSR